MGMAEVHNGSQLVQHSPSLSCSLDVASAGRISFPTLCGMALANGVATCLNLSALEASEQLELDISEL